MSQFPTNKTVPLDKDIGVADPKPASLGTLAREQLSVVLDTIDTKLAAEIARAEAAETAETTRAEAAEANLQTELNTETARAEAAEAAETAARIAADNAEQTRAEAAETQLQNEIDGERALLRITVVPGTAQIHIAPAFATRQTDGTQLALPNGNLISDLVNPVAVDFAAGTVTGSNFSSTFAPVNFAGKAAQWTKYALVLLPGVPNTVLVLPGADIETSAAAVAAPAFSGGIPIGVVAVQDNGSAGVGTIQNLTQAANIIQFEASAGGNGSEAEDEMLMAEPESTLEYYTPSDFRVQTDTFLASTTGNNQILGLKKVILNSGQQLTSKDLTGPQMQADNVLINYAQARVEYGLGKVDYSPTLEVSRNGGLSWNPMIVSNLGTQSNLVLGDFDFGQNVSTLVDGGTPGASTSSGTQIAILFSPSYRMKLTNFLAYLSTLSTAGTVSGALYSVFAGLPQTLISQCPESYVASQDITSTYAYSQFTFNSMQTLNPGTVYAFVVTLTGGNALLTAKQVTSPDPESQGSATYNSSWTPSASSLAYKVVGTGCDLRLRVTSSMNSSEVRGFGMDYVDQIPTSLITYSESSMPQYFAVVGSAVQFNDQIANFTSIQAALNAAPSGAAIYVLSGTYIENITLSKQVSLQGQGRGAYINGSVDVQPGATYSDVTGLRFNSINFENLADGLAVYKCWVISGGTVSGDTNSQGSDIRIIREA